MHKKIAYLNHVVLVRDSISSGTKKCIFLVGTPSTLYLGLSMFLSSLSKAFEGLSTVVARPFHGSYFSLVVFCSETYNYLFSSPKNHEIAKHHF